MEFTETYKDKLVRKIGRHLNNLKVVWMAYAVLRAADNLGSDRPVLFFKATSGIDDLSWNSAFQVLTAWGLRMRGIPVEFFVCDHGMSRCILGTDRDNQQKTPPCATCTYQSSSIYAGFPKNRFGFKRDAALYEKIKDLAVDQLEKVEHGGIPLGGLVLPGLRWILRRHHLLENETTRFFYREYILSAWNIAQNISGVLDQKKPSSVVVFNGQFFPEATVRWVALKKNIRVISHEVGLRPMTAFFTDGESTAYPIHIPNDLPLNEAQNKRLDAYLEDRFKGNFTMGGIKFWPSIQGLSQEWLDMIARYKAVIPVFTNVVFDTSQPHANTLFSDMFEWLDLVVEVAEEHPQTLFIIRAHPDETRPNKTSLETVQQWYEKNDVAMVKNIRFISPDEYISSYELIERAKFVLIYNSTIGLEASLMKIPVLCAGRARFTQIPTVFYPPSRQEYENVLKKYLAAADIGLPAEFSINSRKFLYYQLFKSSLPFGEFLVSSFEPTQSILKLFNPDQLTRSPSLQTIYQGLFEDGDFLLKD